MPVIVATSGHLHKRRGVHVDGKHLVLRPGGGTKASRADPGVRPISANLRCFGPRMVETRFRPPQPIEVGGGKTGFRLALMGVRPTFCARLSDMGLPAGSRFKIVRYLLRMSIRCSNLQT